MQSNRLSHLENPYTELKERGQFPLQCYLEYKAKYEELMGHIRPNFEVENGQFVKPFALWVPLAKKQLSFFQKDADHLKHLFFLKYCLNSLLDPNTRKLAPFSSKVLAIKKKMKTELKQNANTLMFLNLALCYLICYINVDKTTYRGFFNIESRRRYLDRNINSALACLGLTVLLQMDQKNCLNDEILELLNIVITASHISSMQVNAAKSYAELLKDKKAMATSACHLYSLRSFSKIYLGKNDKIQIDIVINQLTGPKPKKEKQGQVSP